MSLESRGNHGIPVTTFVIRDRRKAINLFIRLPYMKMPSVAFPRGEVLTIHDFVCMMKTKKKKRRKIKNIYWALWKKKTKTESV